MIEAPIKLKESVDTHLIPPTRSTCSTPLLKTHLKRVYDVLMHPGPGGSPPCRLRVAADVATVNHTNATVAGAGENQMFVEMIPADAVHIILVYIEEMLEREKRKTKREKRKTKREKKREKKREGEKIEWRSNEEHGSVHEVSRSVKHRHTCEYNRTHDVHRTMCAIRGSYTAYSAAQLW